jgi:hypothetical protein
VGGVANIPRFLPAALLLAGCQAGDPVHSQPALWEAGYPVPYRAMADCLAVQVARAWRVAADPRPRDGATLLRLAPLAGGAVVAEYEVWQIAPQHSIVTWRHIDGFSLESRAVADGCARSLAG